MTAPAGGGRTTTRATLRDVARVAGVHPATASRALNEDTRSLVTQETFLRVTRAAEELAYHPNPIARGLRTSRSYTIGVVIPDIANPLFPPVVRGIEDRLGEARYSALMANTDNDREREGNAVQALRSRQVDGFILATARNGDRALHDLIEAGMPVALVNRRWYDRRLPLAAVDDRHGMHAAVAHLAALGHRDIAHIGVTQELSTGRERCEGFVQAMHAAGLEPAKERILLGESFTEREGARLCAALLDGGTPVTAIVAANDLLALGCYDALEARGIDCPGAMSVVGFNDMPFADRFRPALTTVRIPQYAMGVAAAELLLERLADGGTPPREVLLRPELIVRGSTGAAPDA